MNAYTLFETLNARGLELTTTDLLKNYFFSKVRAGTDIDALKRRWQKLIATVTQERFPDFSATTCSASNRRSDDRGCSSWCVTGSGRRRKRSSSLRRWRLARSWSIYVEDERFESDFARWTVSSRGQRSRIARYVLARLETDAGERAVDPETDRATVEHVLSENPTGEWTDAFPPERWEATVNRLGNLTLLGRHFERATGPARCPPLLD